MRVLLVEDDEVEALAAQCEIGTAHETKIVTSIDDCIRILLLGDWSPDLIVASTKSATNADFDVISSLQEHAPGVPVVVGTETAPSVLRAGPRDTPNAAISRDIESLAYFRLMSAHQQALQMSLAPGFSGWKSDGPNLTDEAIERAVERGVRAFIDRSGLEDLDGLRMAIKFARGWETAKSKFVAAIMTGVAGSVLAALAAGIVTLIKAESRK